MASTVRPRVNYDEIAPLYDTQPYRQKTADAALTHFVQSRPLDTPLTVLDLGCGTGNQLVANQAVYPAMRYIGVDRFYQMLRQAQPKSATITWIQADGAALPLRNGSADFITSQFMLHHVAAKAEMLADVLRLLRPSGRFVVTNICPQEMLDWLYYRYFPEAREVDLEDFWPPDQLAAVLRQVGFDAVQVELQHMHYEVELGHWLETVRRRDNCSQLVTIPNAAYHAGVQRVVDAVASTTGRCQVSDHVCVVTVRGDKGAARR